MGPFLKKYRELLVVAFLLAAPLVTYAAHAERAFMPGPLRRGVVWVTSPFQRALVWSVAEAQDAWYGYVDLRGVRAQNQQLRAQLLKSHDADQKVVELTAENERLRKLVSFAENNPEMHTVAASVIAFGPDPKYRSVRIGRGAQDGLRPGMPVVTPDGVVGRLLQVYDTSADVLLVIDPSSAVAALSQRTRARATARGLAEPGKLRLDYIVKSDDIEEGDILVTAPSGGLFPKGLRLGRATGVAESSHGLFKNAQLVPAVDFARLEEVQVVVDNGPSARLEQPVSSVLQ